MRVLGVPPAHAAAQDVPGAEVGRPAAPDERVSRGAVGRRAAAHRDRARAGQRSAARARRRADRQPRSRSVARNHEPVPRDQRARHDGRRRHARSRADSARRPPRGHARSRPHRGGRLVLRASGTRSTKRPRACGAAGASALAVDADDRRRPVRARRLPRRDREPAAPRWRVEQGGRAVGLPARTTSRRSSGRARGAARRGAAWRPRAQYVSKADALRASGRRSRLSRTARPARRQPAAGVVRGAAEARVARDRRGGRRAGGDASSSSAGVADVRYDRQWLARLGAAISGVRGVGLAARARCWRLPRR